MGIRILVACASAFGSTGRVAEAIAATLRDAETVVEVRYVLDVADLGAYDAVVVGSAIYNGAWLPEAIYFVRTFAPVLSTMPVAYFAVSMTMKEDTPENRCRVLAYLASVRQAAPAVRPLDIGLFGGRLRYRNLPLLDRLIFWLMARLPGGDYRNWAAVRRWAARIKPLLVGAAQRRMRDNSFGGTPHPDTHR